MCQQPGLIWRVVLRLEIIRAWARDHRDFLLRLFETIKSARLEMDENGLGLCETGSHCRD